MALNEAKTPPAAVAGRSMEAEARAILAAACGDASEPHDASSLQTWVDHLYGSKKPRDTATELIRERRREAKKK